MTLREKIEKAISAGANVEESAIEVCKLLENDIGLSGNGWFDDDPEMLDKLNDE